MSPGFVKDVNKVWGFGMLLRWLHGTPHNSIWSGITGVEGRTGLPVGGFRCPECGWLDLYAGTLYEAR